MKNGMGRLCRVHILGKGLDTLKGSLKPLPFSSKQCRHEVWGLPQSPLHQF